MTAPPSRCGVLLAGGANTRFGGAPKGLASLGGARVADHVLRALRSVCAEIVIAANDPAACVWFPEFRVIGDAEPGRGALGALETALRAAPGCTVIVCAWDMPFVSASVLDALATAVEAGAACCVPQHPDGRLEPLCAAYNSADASTATMLLADGARAAHDLVTALGGARWAIPASTPEREFSRMFHNVNTPADLALAVEWFALAQSHS